MKNLNLFARKYPTIAFIFTCIGFFLYAFTVVVIVVIFAVAFAA